MHQQQQQQQHEPKSSAVVEATGWNFPGWMVLTRHNDADDDADDDDLVLASMTFLHTYIHPHTYNKFIPLPTECAEYTQKGSRQYGAVSWDNTMGSFGFWIFLFSLSSILFILFFFFLLFIQILFSYINSSFIFVNLSFCLYHQQWNSIYVGEREDMRCM